MLHNVQQVDKPEEELLLVRQAASFLGCHPDTLRRWEKSGKLQVIRHPMNGYRLYRKDSLKQILSKLGK